MRKIKIPKDFYKKLNAQINFDWNEFYKLCRDNVARDYIKFNFNKDLKNKKKI